MPLPERSRLPHAAPPWVESGACFFITICGAPRGLNQLATLETGSRILQSVEHYHANATWWVHIALLMPDHVHALLSVAPGISLVTTVSAWKSWQTKTLGVKWQAGFFDHRLRSDESFEEKASYIRQNPVRAGLITHAGNWPYIWPRPL